MPTPVNNLETVIVAPSFILRQLLIDLGLAVAADASQTAWQAHCVAEPLDPDQVITVYDTEGVDNGRIQFDGSRVEHRGCQIRVRGGKYDNDGYNKARTVATALDTKVRRTVVTVESIAYLVHAINRKSDVIYIGEDTPASRRKVFTINVTVTVGLNP